MTEGGWLIAVYTKTKISTIVDKTQFSTLHLVSILRQKFIGLVF